MRKRVLIALALIAGLVVGPAGAAHAQCGPALTTAEALAQTEVAFIGKVIDRSNRDRTAIMEVAEIWKGRRLPATVTVNGGPENVDQQTSIDRTFLLGQFYLVMPANGRSPFNDSLCSGTQLWTTPNGEIPERFQEAVGNTVPIAVLTGDSAVEKDEGLADSFGNFGVAIGVLALALGLIYGVRKLSTLGGRPAHKTPAQRTEAHTGNLRPATFRTRKRLFANFSLPKILDSRRGSRLEQVRRATRRSRKGPGEHEKEQLKRAVRLTATKPPSRRNHYTSGRRSAP